MTAIFAADQTETVKDMVLADCQYQVGYVFTIHPDSNIPLK
jgi:hypothetical protein